MTHLQAITINEWFELVAFCADNFKFVTTPCTKDQCTTAFIETIFTFLCDGKMRKNDSEALKCMDTNHQF